jgi:hypothetical protein
LSVSSPASIGSNGELARKNYFPEQNGSAGEDRAATPDGVHPFDPVSSGAALMRNGHGNNNTTTAAGAAAAVAPPPEIVTTSPVTSAPSTVNTLQAPMAKIIISTPPESEPGNNGNSAAAATETPVLEGDTNKQQPGVTIVVNQATAPASESMDGSP